MYIPSSNAENDPGIIFDFIEAHSLGALVTTGADGLFATHLPLLVDRTRGPHGTLQGHIARANPHHRMADSESEALVIFTGPDAYITPAWYPAKAEHGKVVPTWNYVAVHAHGTLRFIQDPAFPHAHLQALTTRHEAGRDQEWSVSDAPAEFIAGLERAIVGVEITITRLEGKWKMSQNRSAADIDGVVRGLADSGDEVQQRVAEIVEARRPAR
ncbi:FMN-binding negative transcriptional regulator [Longimicrobium terrae]|uniref:Transcriptional regulator n=1 Tax=Longimicrobium terrae TaxID=1639882 RepID=A0A841H2M3_9BACT|nr:FMN-binding negative transcriptional regulator [Longimicrobium terrae]MBB4637996.1 transcriptional regulator [Longimicrobium terrae]MBB6072243.1 transcriptional regulator [Longimicrobium terrae]NNC28336.1 FMN-binding negative transcriptional regulator [Longimicrobium terrae]